MLNVELLVVAPIKERELQGMCSPCVIAYATKAVTSGEAPMAANTDTATPALTASAPASECTQKTSDHDVAGTCTHLPSIPFFLSLFG